jgi:hypothetical protein
MDGEFSAAASAEYGFRIPLTFRPNFNRVTGQCNVTIFASVVNATTLHFDRNNVGRPVIVFAAGLRINMNTSDFEKMNAHCSVGKVFEG